MRLLLCHTKTKMELPTYLAAKTVQCAERKRKDVVVTWFSECQATHRDISHLESSQEEADTKLILHGIDAVGCGGTQIDFFSPDTDVLILLLRRYPEHCCDVLFL